MAIEIEKKYRVNDSQIDYALSVLSRLGAEYIGERFEENILFFNDKLTADGAFLRLRVLNGKGELTYKRRLGGQDSDMKTQYELSAEVNNSSTMKEMIEHLGLEKRLIYEKRRKIWEFEETEVVFDELPFGKFIEIEGTPETILKAESLLFESTPVCEPLSYPILTKSFGKLSENVTMAVFE